MSNTENRELTAAELDLVAGGFYALVGGIVPGGAIISSFQTSLMAPTNGGTGSAGTGNNTGSAMYDVRQNRAG
jgi:hypothetical protein